MLAALSNIARAAVATVLLAACATPDSSTALPTRPPIPNGWQTLVSDDGSVSLVLPPDIGVVSTAGGVLAQEAMTVEGVVELEVHAAAPPAMLDQPDPGQTLEDWLREQHMAPVDDGVMVIGSTSTASLALPSGAAAEVRTSVFPGRPDASLVVSYAIRTTGGVGVLRFIGRPERLEERAADVRLIAHLLSFDAPRRVTP